MLRKIVSKNDLKIKNYHKKILERAVSNQYILTVNISIFNDDVYKIFKS